MMGFFIFNSTSLIYNNKMSTLLMSPTRSIGLSSPPLLPAMRSPSPTRIGRSVRSLSPIQHRAGSMTREVRFKPEQTSPGPADYIKYATQVSTRGASPIRSAVFGTSKREQTSPLTPAPGMYDRVGGSIRAKGGSFGKSERQVAKRLRRNCAPGPASYSTSMTTLKKNGGSFGNSKRFGGPLDYANSDKSVPGPGHYGGLKLNRTSVVSGLTSIPTSPRSSFKTADTTRSTLSYVGSSASVLSPSSSVIHSSVASPASPVSAPTLGEQAWFDFCQRCRVQGLTEEELLILSLDTLKSLMQKVDFNDVVDAARVEVQWRQLRQLRPQVP